MILNPVKFPIVMDAFKITTPIGTSAFVYFSSMLKLKSTVTIPANTFLIYVAKLRPSGLFLLQCNRATTSYSFPVLADRDIYYYVLTDIVTAQNPASADFYSTTSNPDAFLIRIDDTGGLTNIASWCFVQEQMIIPDLDFDNF